jgi:hypothetical protein
MQQHTHDEQRTRYGAGALLIPFTGTRSQGLFKSADQGETWQHVEGLKVGATPNGNGIAFVLFDARAQAGAGPTRNLYVGVSRPEADSVFVSTDAGASFRAVPGQPKAFTPQRAALSSAGVLYVTYGNGPDPHGSDLGPIDRGAVWKLDTHTGAWTEITPLRAEQNRAFCGISVDAADPNRLLTTTVNTYLPQPWGHGDRMQRTDDAGASWTRVRGLDFDAAPAADGVDAELFYAYAPKTGAFHVSRDGGRSFTQSALLAAGGGERIRSDDRGLSFVRVNDAAHEYGGPANGQFVLGDANVYGRVFMSSAGRGIVYGQPE